MEEPGSGIGYEAPIKKASDDRLRRSEFANRIAGVLSEISPREGRVFAIRGGWGYGKSSLKNLITEKIDSIDKGAMWIDFNPWQWGDGDAIVRALFVEIAKRLGGENSEASRERAKAMRRYGELLSGASSPLKEASHSDKLLPFLLTNASVISVATAIGLQLPSAAMVAGVLAAFAAGIPSVGRILLYFGRDRSNEPLDDVRKSLEQKLLKLERPLVIFVDDIDRLEPDQIRILLRQVKANGNLPNIVFVLLFQRSIVENALNPISNNNGRAFLEKIVQTNFDLPAVPSSTVQSIFLNELEAVAAEYVSQKNGFEKMRWADALRDCISPSVRSLRDARRLMSSISVHLPLHVKDDVLEVSFVDFLLLETLRVFEPGLHERLFFERPLLLKQGPYSIESQSREKEAFRNILDAFPESRRAINENTLRLLFPTVQWALDSKRDGFDATPIWIIEKRVCTQRLFPRYFELNTAIGELSEHGFTAFLAAAKTEVDFKAEIGNIEANGLLESLVKRCDESVGRLPIINAEVVLLGLFIISQKIAISTCCDPFNHSWTATWSATRRYLARLPYGERGSLLLNAFSKTKALNITAMLIDLCDPAIRESYIRNSDDSVLDQETMNSLLGAWLSTVREYSAGPNLLSSDSSIVFLLLRWGEYAGSMVEPFSWVQNEIRDDDGFVKMAKKLLVKSSNGNIMFSKRIVMDLIGIETAKERCEKIDLSRYPDEKRVLKELQSSCETWLHRGEPTHFE